MVNKKFEIKWRNRFCDSILVSSFTNLHEFAGALMYVCNDEHCTLVDVTTYDVLSDEH